MKKLAIVLILIIGLFIAGCSSTSQSTTTANTQPMNEAGLRPVAQEELDALGAGAYGEAWDLRTDEAKAVMNREDYIRLNTECKAKTGYSFDIQKITINGDSAEVRVKIDAGAQVNNDSCNFIYEHGQWLYDPPADIVAQEKLGVDKDITQLKAAGQCLSDVGSSVDITTSTTSTFSDEKTSRILVGNTWPSLPTGQANEVSIVAQGSQIDENGLSGALPVVIRNNTSDPVIAISASATVRDAGGKLIASGQDQGFWPWLVNPGNIAIGYVFFSGDNFQIPAGAKIDFQLNSKPTNYMSPSLGKKDLTISETNDTGSNIIGTLKNNTEYKAALPEVYMMCFDSSGKPISDANSFATPNEIEPGGTASFELNYSRLQSCPIYLIGAEGG
ncbi:MAG: FxLYD domain-containing protein [Thermoleophilia bacterium]